MEKTLEEGQGLCSDTTGHPCGDVREAGTGELNMGVINIFIEGIESYGPASGHVGSECSWKMKETFRLGAAKEIVWEQPASLRAK